MLQCYKERGQSSSVQNSHTLTASSFEATMFITGTADVIYFDVFFKNFFLFLLRYMNKTVIDTQDRNM